MWKRGDTAERVSEEGDGVLLFFPSVTIGLLKVPNRVRKSAVQAIKYKIKETRQANKNKKPRKREIS